MSYKKKIMRVKVAKKLFSAKTFPLLHQSFDRQKRYLSISPEMVTTICTTGLLVIGQIGAQILSSRKAAGMEKRLREDAAGTEKRLREDAAGTEKRLREDAAGMEKRLREDMSTVVTDTDKKRSEMKGELLQKMTDNQEAAFRDHDNIKKEIATLSTSIQSSIKLLIDSLKLSNDNLSNSIKLSNDNLSQRISDTNEALKLIIKIKEEK